MMNQRYIIFVCSDVVRQIAAIHNLELMLFKFLILMRVIL